MLNGRRRSARCHLNGWLCPPHDRSSPRRNAISEAPRAAGYRGSDFVPCAAFSDAEMLGSPHSRTVGVGEAPRHEVAAIGALGYNGRYGDLIGAQALIVGSRSPRTRFRHASGLEGLRDRGGGNLHSGDLRRRSGAFGQVGSVPAQDQRIGPSKLRAGSRVCLMTCRS